MADSPKVPLGNKPGVVNWTEKYNALGGKTNWIRRVAEHLKGKGMPDGIAIATAVNAAQKMCESGDTNFPGVQQVNPGSRAEACAAYAKWNAAKARAKAARATNMTARRASDAFRQIDLTRSYLLVKSGDKTGMTQGSVSAYLDLATPNTVERQKLASKGKALPGGRFPIRNHDDVKKAIRAVGRAKPRTEQERAKVRRHIIRNAKRIKATHLIPSSWKANGSLDLSAGEAVWAALLDLSSTSATPGFELVPK